MVSLLRNKRNGDPVEGKVTDPSNKSIFQQMLDHNLAIRSHYEKLSQLAATLVLSYEKGADFADRIGKDLVEGITYGGHQAIDSNIEQEIAEFIPKHFKRDEPTESQ